MREHHGDAEADAEAGTLVRSRINSFAEEDDARHAPRARTESYNMVYDEDEESTDEEAGDGSPPYAPRDRTESYATNNSFDSDDGGDDSPPYSYPTE